MNNSTQNDLEVALRGNLEHPDIWAKVLRELAGTDNENRTETLLLLQLAQPVRAFLHTAAAGNTEPDRLAVMAQLLLLASMYTKPVRVTLSHDQDTGEHKLLALSVFGASTPLFEANYMDEQMHDATRDYANLTEWLRVPAALNRPCDSSPSHPLAT
jgi:hypothetical protein